MISLTIAAALALLNTSPDQPALTRPLTSAAYRPIDAHEFDRLKSGVPAASITIDLPLRGCVRMDLVRTQLVTDDFALEIAHIEHVSGGKLNPGATTARVSSQLIEPILPLAYTGTIAAEPDARVYLGFGIGDGDGLIAGVIEIADQSWWISSGSATARRSGLPAMIAHESALAGQPLDGVHCAAMDLRENQENGDHGNGSGADPNFDGGVAGGAGCREFRLAVDTDTEFTMSAHGGNTVAAAQYALLLLGAASQVYARDIDARLPVAYLRLWTGEDPWNQAGMIDQLTEYQSYWNANMNGVSRDLGHYLAGRGLGGGVAWLSVACANQQYGYGLSSGIGYGFPYPLIDHDYGNWEPMVVCHEIGHNFANVDITKESIPVVPTIHYQMGGIPTNINGQVVVPKDGNPNSVVDGLYAVGECSCVSVHGANRLGTNSLLDLLVFGRAAGNHIVSSLSKSTASHKPVPADAAEKSLARIARLDASTEGEYAQDVANDIRDAMQLHAGVFRTQVSMDEGKRKIAALRERVAGITLKDKSKVFNTARIEALEVENLIEAAQATIESAAARHECRGAHTVSDYERGADDAEFPLGRNDAQWMKHTLWYSQDNRLDYKPVQLKPLTVDSVPPKVRTF